MKHHPISLSGFQRQKGKVNVVHASRVYSGTQTCYQSPRSVERATAGPHLSTADQFLSPLRPDRPSAYPCPARRNGSGAQPSSSMPWHIPVCCGWDSLGAPGHGAWWTHLPVSWGEPNRGPLGSRVGTGHHHPSSIYLRKALVELPPTQPNSSKGSHSWLPSGGGGGCPSLTPGSACLQPLLIVAFLLEQHLRALPEPGSVGTNASGSTHKRSASDGIISFIHCTAGPGRGSHLKAMP